VIEHAEEFCARLMDRTDYCATAESQELQQRQTLETRWTIQPAANSHTHSSKMSTSLLKQCK